MAVFHGDCDQTIVLYFMVNVTIQYVHVLWTFWPLTVTHPEQSHWLWDIDTLFIQSLYKFGSCLFDCLIVCLSVRLSRFFIGSWLSQRTSDPHQTFTKMETFVSQTDWICSEHCTCSCARTARENVHAIFAYFFGQFFDILKPTFCVTFWSQFFRHVSQPNQLETSRNFQDNFLGVSRDDL